MNLMLGIIGGSGFYKLGKKVEEIDVITPYGPVLVNKVKVLRKNVYFIPRHGKNHFVPPHKVNYKANVYALKKLGIKAAFSTYSSGILSKYKPGDLILLDDFIGLYTPITFFDDFSSGIKHHDFTEAFDKEMKNAVLESAFATKVKLKKGGVIVTTPGSRFETKAEVKFLKKTGANLVNMTSAYEITLMKEAEIPFAAIAIGTNFGCGIKKKPLSYEEVIEVMAKSNKKIIGIVSKLVEHVYD